jgi:flagellar biogenesis protein FliO
MWLGLLGGALLLGILVVAVLAPGDGGGYEPGPQVSVDTTSTAPATEEPGTQSFSLGAGDLASLAWRLGLVIAIIAVSIVGLRWWARRTTGPRSGTGFLRVLDTLAVGNGRTIHLVALGERVIVVGATQQSLAYLNELTEDETSRVMTEAAKPVDEALGNFAADLAAAFRGVHRDTPRREASMERPS